MRGHTLVALDLLDDKPAQHSLRVDLGEGTVERHGVYQPGIPVRAGVAYRGYLWMKANEYDGRVLVALEQDVTGGTQRRVVVTDPLVRAVAAPEERDERAGVGVDDPQVRPFGAP